MKPPRCFALVLLLGACGGGGAAGSDAAATDDTAIDDVPVTPSSPQLPPQGQKALEAWLAAGFYKQWVCEKAISEPRRDPANASSPLGMHGRHRICSNDALLASSAGPYPVGAASVKEQFDENDGPYGFSVGVKVAPGLGAPTWYWYERIGRLATLAPLADGIGVKACGADCHAVATRDNVFIRAQ